MVVDDQWVSVGSTNFDSRSFRLNAEANLNVIDRGLALQERRAFEKDLLRSRRITVDEWLATPGYAGCTRASSAAKTAVTCDPLATSLATRVHSPM